MAEQVCPPLGTGSVDMNALHAALVKKQPAEDALAKATTGGPPEPAAEIAAEPEAPAPAPEIKA